MKSNKCNNQLIMKDSDTLSDTLSMPKIIDDHLICTLFNLDPHKIQLVKCERDPAANVTVIHITLHPTYPPCPICGARRPLIKDYYIRKIKHSVLNDSRTVLSFRDRRYLCPFCHHTYFAMNPFTEKAFRHSSLTTQLILKDLKDPNMTMSAVARRHHVSSTTIANVFDAHVDIGRRRLPKFLSIDEVYAFRSDKSKYICVLLDYKNKTPVEILPSRTYEDLMRFFSAIPIEERREVSVFSTDMWRTYRSIAQRYLPACIVIVDHFHVIQECNRRLDKIRIKTQKSFSRKSNEYYLLKKFSLILFKNDEHLLDANQKKRYNRKMKQYLNYHDIKYKLQESHPHLETAINLKDSLCMYYDTIKLIEKGEDPAYQEILPELKIKEDGKATIRSKKLYDEAKKRNDKRVLSEAETLHELEELIDRFRACPLEEFSSFASTLNEWKHEIVNSLRIYTELDRKAMSNALIENRNKIIKNVKRTSNGYGNWRRFRNRLMFTLTPESTFSLMADETVIERKRKSNHEHYMKWKSSHERI